MLPSAAKGSLVKYVRFTCGEISRAEIDNNTYIGKFDHGLHFCQLTHFQNVSTLSKYLVAVNIGHFPIVLKRFNIFVKSPIDDLGEDHARA